MNKYTQLANVILANSTKIASIHIFEEIRDPYVCGVEVRLHKKSDSLTIDSKYDQVHPDPFKDAVPYYLYLVLGLSNEYKKWVKQQFDGRVAQRVCRKFNYFEQPVDNQEVDRYRATQFTSMAEQFTQAYKIAYPEADISKQLQTIINQL